MTFSHAPTRVLLDPWARMRHGQARRPCLFVRGVFVCCLRPVGFTVDHSPDSGHVDDAPISAYHAGSQISPNQSRPPHSCALLTSSNGLW